MSDWIDGESAVWPAAVQAGLVQGDGVFRTLLVWHGALIDAAGQHAILEADAARIGVSCPPLEVWLADSHSACAAAASGRVRWWLARRSDTPANGTAADHSVRWVSAAALPQRAASCWQRGVAVTISPIAVAEQRDLAGVKHLNRLPQVLAGRSCTHEQPEALMCDHDGHLVCGTRSNLFWVESGQVFTPSLERGGVDGWMRRRLMALSASQGHPVSVCRARPEVLERADEVLLTNSLIGLWPVRSMGACQWAAPGPVTLRLAHALAHPLYLHMTEYS